MHVWRKSMDLVEALYELTAKFPKKEEYRLTNQILRAVISIPANIAEGQRRSTRKDYAKFVSIAHGSTAEVETFLIVASRVKYVSEEEIRPHLEAAGEISRMLNALRQRLLSNG
ncbi:four helix bundle protein [Hyphococcus sp.]|uniref:four helix bundle protein n=1 Tax=Hyphococcus sp. TaxID=2038636 RepID=UPI0035C6C145